MVVVEGEGGDGQMNQVNRCRKFGLVLLAQLYGKVKGGLL